MRPGSSGPRSRARWSRAATTCARRCAPARRARRSTGSTSSSPSAQLGDRAALRRALRGVDRVFHVAGTTYLRASPAELTRVNVEGTRVVMEEALRAGVERVVHTSSIGAVGPARPGGAVDERAPFPPGPRRALRGLQARRRVRGAAGGGARARRGHRLPVAGVRARRPRADVDRRRAPVPAAADPGLRPGGDQRGRRRRRRRRPPARGRARRDRRALHPRRRATTRGSGCSPSSRGCRGSTARRSRCRCRSRSRSRRPRRTARSRPSRARPRSAPPGCGGRARARARSASSAGRPGRTRTRSRRPCAGGRSSSATGCADAPRSQPAAWRLAGYAARAAGAIGGRIVR